MTDPNATQALSQDPNRTQMIPGTNLSVTQIIQPVQCPICKTHNPAGEAFCVECGLLFSSALPDDAFGAPAVRLPCLVDESGREHFLRPGSNIVGREADILITDARVSRRHAEITLENQTVKLKDLGSTNGTIVNGEKLEPGNEVTLSASDEVMFGGVKLILSFPGEGGITQLPASGKTQSIHTPLEKKSAVASIQTQDAEYPLIKGENTLGRRQNNDIVISDPYASGLHGKFEINDEGAFFTDLGSTNGTLLNGSKLPANEKVRITPDDELQIGRLTFKLSFKQDEATEDEQNEDNS
jgi:pSer/pThr/pTyr-binding forkhead associated (FHA) protein